ncbi:MAG: DNA-binding protein [Desulfobacterales bacterium]|nr:DNA-binding protein [Desulfobacterales bacterium]
MEKLSCAAYETGRRFIGRLPYGKDLIKSVEVFCEEKNIKMATFSAIGAVSSVTMGAYDQKQQVYISFNKEAPLEIVNCTGNVSQKDGKPFLHAHIAIGDEQGKVTGGHLFSETIVFAGEVDIQEITGPSLERGYDETTGLMLWDPPDLKE